MYESRRSVLTVFIAATGSWVIRPLLAFGAPQRGTPQPIPSPNAPNRSYPPGLNGPDIKQDSDHQTIDPKNQKDLRDDVQQLCDLAAELKEQIDKMDANSVLSVSVVKKAQKIEKLAKRVRELSKG